MSQHPTKAKTLFHTNTVRLNTLIAESLSALLKLYQLTVTPLSQVGFAHIDRAYDRAAAGVVLARYGLLT